MAVSREEYIAPIGATPAQVASVFESALKDAGLMTSWYDSFAQSGIEHRILEITYQPGKVYGKTYYWFVFTTSAFSFALATGWDPIGHVPTGTQFLDFLSNNTSVTTNFFQISSIFTTSGRLLLRRFTSPLSSRTSWFTVQIGTFANTSFCLHPGSTSIQPWIDLDRTLYNGLILAKGFSGTFSSGIRFDLPFALRRSFNAQGYLTGADSTVSYVASQTLFRYLYYGKASNSLSNNVTTELSPDILLPCGFLGINSALSADYIPICTGIMATPYQVQPMSTDFGIVGLYGYNPSAAGDKLTVVSGENEWEVVTYSTSFNPSANSSTSMLVARIL